MTVAVRESHQEARQGRHDRSGASTLTPRVVPTPEVVSKPRWPGDSLFEPESPRQVQTFDTYRHRYGSLGLCQDCAAQAAYGHQHGFSVVEQPRHVECWEVVKGLPDPEVNEWRSAPIRHAAAVARLRQSLA